MKRTVGVISRRQTRGEVMIKLAVSIGALLVLAIGHGSIEMAAADTRDSADVPTPAAGGAAGSGAGGTTGKAGSSGMGGSRAGTGGTTAR
jgi:hypothetical protein